MPKNLRLWYFFWKRAPWKKYSRNADKNHPVDRGGKNLPAFLTEIPLSPEKIPLFTGHAVLIKKSFIHAL